MSYPERENGKKDLHGEDFKRLGVAVEASASRIRELRRQLSLARAQGRSLEDQLRKFTGGEEAPSQLLARLDRLEAENEILRDRIQKGREGVERMLARIRFLEEQG